MLPGLYPTGKSLELDVSYKVLHYCTVSIFIRDLAECSGYHAVLSVLRHLSVSFMFQTTHVSDATCCHWPCDVYLHVSLWWPAGSKPF